MTSCVYNFMIRKLLFPNCWTPFCTAGRVRVVPDTLGREICDAPRASGGHRGCIPWWRWWRRCSHHPGSSPLSRHTRKLSFFLFLPPLFPPSARKSGSLLAAAAPILASFLSALARSSVSPFHSLTHSLTLCLNPLAPLLSSPLHPTSPPSSSDNTFPACC